MSIGLKNWLFPTISFVAFLYVMLLAWDLDISC